LAQEKKAFAACTLQEQGLSRTRNRRM